MARLTDSVYLGTWSSSNSAIANVGSSSGIVSGISAGSATITYTVGSGCSVTYTITVSSIAGIITGTTSLHPGGATTLSDAVTGGVWSSSNTYVASINSTTGLVTGVAAGTAMITYTPPGGCPDTALVTVGTQTGIAPLLTGISGITVIPNPNKGTFTLWGVITGAGADNEVKIEVIDILGKVIYTDAATIDMGAINKNITLPDNVANGVYMIKVVNGGMSKVLRFTMER